MPLNKLFTAIKMNCGEKGLASNHVCLQSIQQQFNLNERELAVYFEILENMGVIRFDKHDNILYVTSKGMAIFKIPTTTA
jgi:predicted transcriptional regulator